MADVFIRVNVNRGMSSSSQVAGNIHMIRRSHLSNKVTEDTEFFGKQNGKLFMIANTTKYDVVHEEEKKSEDKKQEGDLESSTPSVVLQKQHHHHHSAGVALITLDEDDPEFDEDEDPDADLDL